MNVMIHVRGAFHGDFVDSPLWDLEWLMRPLSVVIPAAGPVDPDQEHIELVKSAGVFMERKRVDGAEIIEGSLFEYVG